MKFLSAALRDERVRFLLVGGWNTLFGTAMFATLYLLLVGHLHYLAILVISHVLSSINNWLTYRRLVFVSRADRLAEFVRFNASSLTVLAFNFAGLWLLVDFCDWHPIASQILLVAATVVLSYLIHAGYSFRHRGKEVRNDK
ncbi:MAG: GtrA family protein [Rhodocyclales bacterium]|nr:GtrA family protein [Rhodocyclales bacterium]